MALQGNTLIYIGGSPITAFKDFTLHQTIGQHHTFELVCRMDVVEKFNPNELAAETKNYLGEAITVQISSLGVFTGYKELEFKGVVTAINSYKAFNHRNGDVVVISGHSGTIIADDGPHYGSHNDASLADILEETFSGYDKSKLKTVFNPQNDGPLHYSVQHLESSWEYAGRLAAQYSEWFYYDGKKLIFGQPEESEEILLNYGHDLQEFSMELKPQPNNFNYFTNDYLSNEQHQKKTAEVAGANGYNGFASEKASGLYAKETNVWINGYTDPQLKSRLDKQVEQQKKAADQRQVLVKGTSDNPGLGLGKVIKIKSSEEHYGSYRVIKVTHNSNENGRYQNKFEAVSAEMDVYPLTNFNAIPKSETQTAVVVENADPKGIGRIKVQFPWQRLTGEITPWLRIVSPHAGGEKGFHFIPEISEEVLIGFEGGNAERPYVMGALYHGSGKPKSWQTQQNNVKAIRTRSGHTIELNDAQGKEFITITDKNANLITIDTANNNMTITALENMTLNCKNFQLNVKENANFKIGKNTEIFTGKQMNVSANGLSQAIEGEMKTHVGGTLTQIANGTEIQSDGDLKMSGAGLASFKGGNDVKISKG